ncbi:phosphonate ABC transporter, permease protein PhnE [Halorubrum vacuolatum]|uniref:Phosphonate transport system permease protein n=1 Tax=Halorubrum vacuolatum TaxID=63740 RepID=A0A238UUF8_HALVU|nr:phosphonate ABC transporter, permease protein PhnE [Halorubrum vacuolatum]SNR25840.1 phosphonate transport system permease protein [Halorubrum vacuolatum]
MGAARSLEAYETDWSRPTVFYNHTVKWGVYLVTILFLIWNVWEARVSFDRLIYGAGQAGVLLGAFFPPDFGITVTAGGIETSDRFWRIYDGMVETLAMSIVATVAGVLVSIPVAVMGAENLAPRPVYYVGRAIISVTRAIHELIIGIVVVVGFGFGALAGVIALVFATPGFYAKLLAEDLEDIDQSRLEAIRSTGASPLQVLIYGVLPQVLPRVIGLTIYRWDINLRASTILGVVGAGGIGAALLTSFDTYEYDFSMGILLTIIAFVVLGEMLSAYARRRVQ